MRTNWHRHSRIREALRGGAWGFVAICIVVLVSVRTTLAAAQGTVVAWGYNLDGQSTVPTNLSGVVVVDGGASHSLALKLDGTVVAWGDNSFGQVTVPTNLTGVIAVAAGAYHCLALREAGSVISWGQELLGQISVPTNLRGVVAIAAGASHSLVLKEDGRVVAWGSDAYGQTTVPTDLNGVVTIAAGNYHSLALKENGTVVAWGLDDNYQSTVPTNLTGVVAIAAGYEHSLALKTDGTVVAWGDGRYNQSVVPINLSGVIAIAAGDYHSLALKEDGAVVAWGYNFADQTTVPTNLNGVVAIAAGTYHSLALLDDGPPSIFRQPRSQTVDADTTAVLKVAATGATPLRYQWRKDDANLIGQTNATLTLNNVTTNDVGAYSVVVTNRAGSITSVVATLTVVRDPVITTQPQSQAISIRSAAFFTVDARGAPPLSFHWQFNGVDIIQATNSALLVLNVQSNSAGNYTVMVTNTYGAVTSAVATLTVMPPVRQVVLDGTLVAWGSYQDGQTNIPSGLTDVSAVAAGGGHNLALRSDNSVASWGANSFGQASVPFGLRGKAIAAGDAHSLVVRSAGTVVAWGYNAYGQLDVPLDLTNAVAVAAGTWHSLALTSDGKVVAWGWNDYGQTNVPAGLTNVVAIAGGGAHSLALRSDGRVVAWGGESTYGQTNVPGFLTNAIAISAGNVHSLALTEDGRVVAWGYNDWGQGTVPFGISNIVSVKCGYAFNLVLKRDGTVAAWGYNDAGQQIKVPAGLTNVVAIAAGDFHSVALVGHAWPWVISQPKSRTVVAGTTATFTVRASGTLPLHHQWRHNGIDIAGATNETLVLTSAQPTQDGDYTVVVTNGYGVVTSFVASLTVQYRLTTIANGNGTITRSLTQPNYAPDSLVTLTASPATAHAFIGWSGDANGTTNPLTIVMTTNKTVRANFVSTAISITIGGQGAVGRAPDKPFYALGEPVTLVATPARWFTFTRWADGRTDNPRVITIGASNSYAAIFSPTTAVETLTFSSVSRTAPVGMPAIFVDGEFVMTGAVSRLDSSAVSMLTTFPNGSIFYTLDGSAPSFAASLYGGPFALRRSATVRAAAYDASFLNSWEADAVQVIIEPTFVVNASTAGGGTVSVLPTAASYRSNALVTLSATPAPGWTFLQWLGDASDTSATTNVRVMNRDLCAQALFGTTLGTTAVGSGSVVVGPVTALYPYGTVVRLTAVPEPGNYFGAWGNAVMSTNNPLLFQVTNANSTVSCAFGPLSAGQVALTVLVHGRGRVTTNPRGNRFVSNQSVTLTAIADADQDFLGWSGDASGTSTNLTVALMQSKVITANFTKRSRLSLGPCLGGWREDGFQLTLTGEMGGRYRVEQSSGLMNWTTMESFTNTYGAWQMIDTTATNDATRFYRAVDVP